MYRRGQDGFDLKLFLVSAAAGLALLPVLLLMAVLLAGLAVGT